MFLRLFVKIISSFVYIKLDNALRRVLSPNLHPKSNFQRYVVQHYLGDLQEHSQF